MSNFEFIENFLQCFAPLYDKLFYFPGDKRNCLSANADLSSVEKACFTNSFGNSIDIWHLKTRKELRGRIIHCHGSGANISSHFSHVSWLPDFGYEVIMFEYPGYDNSTGKPTRKTTVKTACEIIEKFSNSAAKDLPVFVLGQSLGGNIASVALTETKVSSRIHGVILDSMYSSFRSLGAVKIQRKYCTNTFTSRILSLFISDKNSPLQRASKLKLPTLLMHSVNDEMVPYQESVNFYKAMENKNVQLWSPIYPGHTMMLRHGLENYREKMVQWMESIYK